MYVVSSSHPCVAQRSAVARPIAHINLHGPQLLSPFFVPPFQAFRSGSTRTVQPCIQKRFGHLVPSAKAAADGWWHEQEHLWNFVHSTEELQSVIDSAANLVLIDCFTPWCGGCKLIYPQLCRLALDDELRKQVTFVKVDTDEMKDWAASQQIKTLPYMAFYRQGEGKLIGMQMTPARVKLLRKAIATMLNNRGRTFRLDPNGYVIPAEPAPVAA